MFFVIPDKISNNNTGGDMDFNTFMQIAKYIEEREKSAKEGAKPKDDKKGDFWKNYLILMFLTIPVGMFYFFVITYGMVTIYKTAKGL